MIVEAQENDFSYPNQLVQIMREHRLICPEEEEQITDYLFTTG